jgi:anti-sigma factor RsiW
MSETQDKLNWLAFRYVANELDAAEASNFELLLTTDQAAREAVASAVAQTIQIRQALAGAVVVAATAQRSTWSRKTNRVTLVAVGSCLALLLAVCLLRSPLTITDGVAYQANENDFSNSPAQLAYAWAEARDGSTELQPATEPVLADSLDGVLIAAVDSDFEQSLVTPSWMLAALEKMDGGINSDLEMQE